jgi:hypothetical protein
MEDDVQDASFLEICGAGEGEEQFTAAWPKPTT